MQLVVSVLFFLLFSFRCDFYVLCHKQNIVIFFQLFLYQHIASQHITIPCICLIYTRHQSSFVFVQWDAMWLLLMMKPHYVCAQPLRTCVSENFLLNIHKTQHKTMVVNETKTMAKVFDFFWVHFVDCVTANDSFHQQFQEYMVDDGASVANHNFTSNSFIFMLPMAIIATKFQCVLCELCSLNRSHM